MDGRLIRKTALHKAEHGMTFAVCILLMVAAHLSAAPVRFDVVYEKSSIAVRIDKAGILSAFGAGHQHGIIINEFTARVCADPRTFENTSVSVRVAVPSLRIDTAQARQTAGLSPSGPAAKDIPTIQQKMLSPENLNAGAYPEIRFESSSVIRTGGTFDVRGSLTIRGRTMPVTVPLRMQQAGSDYRLSGEFAIKLKDYGITPESVGGVVKVAEAVTALVDVLARPGTQPCR